jgi:hypothetical protein
MERTETSAEIIHIYMAKIGRKGGSASRGTEAAKIRASRAGKASAASRRAKKKAAAKGQTITLSYLSENEI